MLLILAYLVYVFTVSVAIYKLMLFMGVIPK